MVDLRQDPVVRTACGPEENLVRPRYLGALAADQIRPSSSTAARSDSSSATEASMRARENSEMSRPCTMDQSPPDVVTGKELTSPSGTP